MLTIGGVGNRMSLNGTFKKVTDGEKNDFLWNQWHKIFNHPNFRKVDREYSIYGNLMDWQIGDSREWRIDYVADFKGKRFLIESKLGEYDLLYSGFKIIAYRAAYCIDRFLSVGKIGVMIFFNANSFKIKMRNICAVAKVDYAVLKVVVLDDNKKIYELKECSLW